MNKPISINKPGRTAWRALAYFNLYRFLIAFLFVSLYWIGQLPDPLGKYDKSLFAISSHIYLIVIVIQHLFIHIQRPPHSYQVFGQVLIDTICITLMIYASAGLNSGFGILLVITVAGGGLLSPGKTGILYASIATIAILSHEIYVQLVRDFPPPNYTHAGFLGMTFFITAIISQILAGRVKESEALAQQRGADLEKLAKLNEHIVHRLQAGVIVLDAKLNISLCNEAAKRLLGIDKYISHLSFTEDLPRELVEIIRHRQSGVAERSLIFKSERTGIDIQASIVTLKIESEFEMLVFIDDLSVFRQRAQQLKLASLGRLTASIAHEIRNPLGAISHAGQLLSESISLAQEDKRLTTIIEQHSQRVNQIIENILNLSKRKQAEPVILELGNWLKEFKYEYEVHHKLNDEMIQLSGTSAKIHVKIDSLQLHQILWNLVENGLRYSNKMPLVELHYAIHHDTERPYIDVIDQGPGIKEGHEAQLFEPFFTTETKGSGLGLYIARELCETNQATLNLHRNSANGCCFRIIFSHPDKQHLIK